MITTTLAAGPSNARLLLTVNDVATELGCCRDTVYSLLNTGALTSVRIGTRLRRIRRSDLDAFIGSLPTEPAA